MLRFQGIVGIIVGLLSLCTTASGATNTTMLNKICNGQQYYPYGPYENTVNAVLDDLSANTTTHGYNYYGSFLNLYFQCWGHGACNDVLGQSDHTACIILRDNNSSKSAATLSVLKFNSKIAKLGKRYILSPNDARCESRSFPK
ncbi:hypothetical protein ACJRO7_026856 [Eucalyptus globulus]|uniref:Uncharacterized protein n=1 Tax=Eucalyptus globulus TaxID=34317 RepID=A0ABD3JS15_EUCGL